MKKPNDELVRVITLKYKGRPEEVLRTSDGKPIMSSAIEEDLEIGYTISHVNLAVLDKETVIAFIVLKLWGAYFDAAKKSILDMYLYEAAMKIRPLSYRKEISEILSADSLGDMLVRDFLEAPTHSFSIDILDEVNILKRRFKYLKEEEEKGS